MESFIAFMFDSIFYSTLMVYKSISMCNSVTPFGLAC